MFGEQPRHTEPLIGRMYNTIITYSGRSNSVSLRCYDGSYIWNLMSRCRRCTSPTSYATRFHLNSTLQISCTMILRRRANLIEYITTKHTYLLSPTQHMYKSLLVYRHTLSSHTIISHTPAVLFSMFDFPLRQSRTSQDPSEENSACNASTAPHTTQNNVSPWTRKTQSSINIQPSCTKVPDWFLTHCRVKQEIPNIIIPNC